MGSAHSTFLIYYLYRPLGLGCHFAPIGSDNSIRGVPLVRDQASALCRTRMKDQHGKHLPNSTRTTSLKHHWNFFGVEGEGLQLQFSGLLEFKRHDSCSFSVFLATLQLQESIPFGDSRDSCAATVGVCV